MFVIPGTLSQEEYQFKFDLVNMDLQLKDLAEQNAKQYVLRDNIPREVVSEKLATRFPAACHLKRLMKLDACCVEDVNWDNLLEHRSGDICRKRWTEMARYIGKNKEKPFIEQVEVLWQQYSEMIEYRN